MSVFKSMTISIIIPVFNSHGAVRRQLEYFKLLNLPDSIEIIIMDDGSDPPLKFSTKRIKNCNIYPTGDTRPWTQPCAKNLGAKIAQGEFLFFTDIDHILTREAIAAVEVFDGDKMSFSRSFAVLNNHGVINKDPEMLFKYGLDRRRYKKYGLDVYYHVNTFAIRKRVFEEIGGYPEKICNRGTYPTKDDRFFYHRYRKYCEAGFCKQETTGPGVHVFPAAVKDHMGLFHNLERKNK